MLASLYEFKGDSEAAQAAITRAVESGDRLVSTINLKRVIDASVEEADEPAAHTRFCQNCQSRQKRASDRTK